MPELITITENWIKQRIKMEGSNLEDIRTLILQGNYDEKISYLGCSLLHFTRLKILDLSRNSIKSIKGIEHLLLLEVLNLYYNSIDSFEEVGRLQCNRNLKDLDLRLNPISRLATDYRLFLTNLLPNLKNLDCRAIRDAERGVAISISIPSPCIFSNLHDTTCSSLGNLPLVEDLTPARPTATQDIPKIIRDECPVPRLSKSLMPMNYYQPQRDVGLAKNVSANTDCFRMPSTSWIPSDNIRGLKHAEFYDRRERYLTEIVANEQEKLTYTVDTDRATAIRPDLKTISSGSSQNESTIKLTEPQVVPRGKRYTSSCNKPVVLSNGNGVKFCSGSGKEVRSKSIGPKESTSRGALTNPVEHKKRVDVEAERMDHSFFIMMKNLIHDAVCESFAQLSQNEQPRRNQEDLSVEASGKAVTSTHSNGSHPSITVEPDRGVTSNGHIIKPVETDIARSSAFKLPRSLMDSGTSFVMKKSPEELVSPGLLKSENQRLLAEVERLKSQLKRYEQTEAEPHAWVVAEPTKVVSRIETAAICSTQNEFTIPNRTFRLWQPIRLDSCATEDKESFQAESDR